jgi:hypothetical protein
MVLKALIRTMGILSDWLLTKVLDSAHKKALMMARTSPGKSLLLYCRSSYVRKRSMQKVTVPPPV